jgi:hypothetical protein
MYSLFYAKSLVDTGQCLHKNMSKNCLSYNVKIHHFYYFLDLSFNRPPADFYTSDEDENFILWPPSFPMTFILQREVPGDITHIINVTLNLYVAQTD